MKRILLIHLPHWLMLKALPVIVLTAKIEVEQRIEGLKAGAICAQALFPPRVAGAHRSATAPARQ